MSNLTATQIASVLNETRAIVENPSSTQSDIDNARAMASYLQERIEEDAVIARQYSY